MNDLVFIGARNHPTKRSATRDQRARRRLLRDAEKFSCCYCGWTLPRSVATLEHRLPLVAGGSYEPENLALACVLCNGARARLLRWLVIGKFPDAQKLMREQAWLTNGLKRVDGRWYFVPSLPTDETREALP